MRSVRWLSVASAALLSSVLLCSAGPAKAAPLTDRQVAQSLFEQARELMAKNEYVRACPMLAESQRLDPGGGTLLNLALCYEGEGKLATAQLELSDARAQAMREGRSDRETIAREHLALLAPRVPRLTLVAPAQAVRGLVIELDGVSVSAAATGVALPVDPGAHKVRASAPGYTPWASVETVREGESRRVQLPELAKPGAAPPVAAPPPVDRLPPPVDAPPLAGPTKTFATASWVLAGVSVAALTGSIVTGVIALNTRSEFEKRCFPARGYCSNPTDADLSVAARNLAWASTGLLVGALAAGAAAWLWPRQVTVQSGSTQGVVIAF